jgi:hypothetical protein
VVIYIKYVQCCVNYTNKQAFCFATVRGYAKAVNTLFKVQSLSPPANFSDPNNMTAFLVNNLLEEVDIARQHSPLDNRIFSKLRQVSETSRSGSESSI